MAFSRFPRFRGRAFGRVSRGFRPRNRLSNPQRTKGLEVATFFFEDSTVLDNASAAETQIYTVLAGLPFALGNASAGAENRVGTALQSMQRYIQINGLVYDWGVEQRDWNGGSSNQGDVWFCHQLFTDRVEYDATDLALPATIGSYSPFENLFPVTNLTSANPTRAQRQGPQPTRIHLSRTRVYNTHATAILNDIEGVLYAPSGQAVRQREPTVNRRLRIRVDDDHALFFGWFFRTAANFSNGQVETRTFRRWARGQMYYRFRQ